MKSKITAVASLILSLFVSMIPARAGFEDSLAIRQLASRMADTVGAYEARGWRVHDYTPSWISGGSIAEFTIHLNAGDDMIFRGMGDGDALDLDMAVISPGGRVLARDTDYDSTPLVTLRAPRTGTYTIRVGLPSCRSNGSYCALVVAQR